MENCQFRRKSPISRSLGLLLLRNGEISWVVEKKRIFFRGIASVSELRTVTEQKSCYELVQFAVVPSTTSERQR